MKSFVVIFIFYHQDAEARSFLWAPGLWWFIFLCA